MTTRAQRIQKRRRSRLRSVARTLHRRLYQDDSAIALPMLADAAPTSPPGHLRGGRETRGTDAMPDDKPAVLTETP